MCEYMDFSLYVAQKKKRKTKWGNKNGLLLEEKSNKFFIR